MFPLQANPGQTRVICAYASSLAINRLVQDYQDESLALKEAQAYNSSRREGERVYAVFDSQGRLLNPEIRE